MKLFATKLEISVVVWAADEEQARTLARSFEPDERRHAQVTFVEPVIDPEKLPAGWDTGSLPYGRDDDTTIGMIIGNPVRKEHIDG